MKTQIAVAAIVVSIILLAFWFWPYSDDFTSEYQQVADKVVEIIEQEPTSDGVSKARKYFSSRETHLKDRFKFGLKPDDKGAVSETVRRRYQDVVNKGSAPLGRLADAHPELKRDIQMLMADMGMQRLSY